MNPTKPYMKKPELIVFDIDGTMTRSKLPLDAEMAGLLDRLLGKYKVAIISGANYKQFQWQILDQLKCSSEKMKNLYLLPVDGTVFCSYQDGWRCQYDLSLSEEEKERIRDAFENIFEESGFEKPTKTYGKIVEDRGAQLNFSAFGQDAPIELKESWDPDNRKRAQMIEILKKNLSDFSLRFGGTTSIEVSRKGIDKAYGLNKLMKETGVSKGNILFLGDKLSGDGNDAPVLTLEIKCRAVNNPEDTKQAILEFLES